MIHIRLRSQGEGRRGQLHESLPRYRPSDLRERRPRDHDARRAESGIKSFWEYVGRNMQDPTWIWGTPQVDVLSPDAAVVTTTYRIPHRTPAGEPHTVAGAWTAVFARRNGKWAIVQEHLSEMPAECWPPTRATCRRRARASVLSAPARA